ncbi:unnamed protein product, partial [Musa acuminata var. zebrina]
KKSICRRPDPTKEESATLLIELVCTMEEGEDISETKNYFKFDDFIQMKADNRIEGLHLYKIMTATEDLYFCTLKSIELVVLGLGMSTLRLSTRKS